MLSRLEGAPQHARKRVLNIGIDHVELRKILPKGTSFEGLDAATVAEICSHVNSSVRRGCGNAAPFDLAQLMFPKYLFENLGLRRIAPENVIAAPNILYRPE